MRLDYADCGKIGFTCGAFDMLHAGHIVMLEEASKNCEYLIVGLQIDPSLDRPDRKTPPVQSIVERQIQLAACRFVDEIVVYHTEKDLLDVLLTLPIDIRFLDEDYMTVDFTGKDICKTKGIELHYNKRDHSFSSTKLKNQAFESEATRRASLPEL